MVNCSIIGCKSRNSERKDPNITFHRFPQEEFYRNKWIESTGRVNWQPHKSSRICSKHFKSNRFRPNKNDTCVYLKHCSVPTLFIHNQQAFDLQSTSRCEMSTLNIETKKKIGENVDQKDEEIICNECDQRIAGFRYTCVQCLDVDLCGACEARQLHDTHYVLRIPPARPQTEVFRMLSRIREVLGSFIHIQHKPDDGEPCIKNEMKMEAGPDPLNEENPDSATVPIKEEYIDIEVERIQDKSCQLTEQNPREDDVIGRVNPAPPADVSQVVPNAVEVPVSSESQLEGSSLLERERTISAEVSRSFRRNKLRGVANKTSSPGGQFVVYTHKALLDPLPDTSARVIVVSRTGKGVKKKT